MDRVFTRIPALFSTVCISPKVRSKSSPEQSMPWCANMAASYFFVCTFGTVIKNMISVIGGLPRACSVWRRSPASSAGRAFYPGPGGISERIRACKKRLDAR